MKKDIERRYSSLLSDLKDNPEQVANELERCLIFMLKTLNDNRRHKELWTDIFFTPMRFNFFKEGLERLNVIFCYNNETNQKTKRST